MRSVSAPYILISKKQSPQNVTGDLRVFFETPDGVRMPLLSKRNINAHSMSISYDLIPEFNPYAI